jgi:hypothetical protein
MRSDREERAMTAKHPETAVHFGGEGGNAPYVLGLVDGGSDGTETLEDDQAEPVNEGASFSRKSWGGLDVTERGVGQWWEIPPMN